MRYGVKGLDLWAKERAAAKTLKCGLKVLCDTSQWKGGSYPALKVWKPKAKNPYMNCCYSSEKQRSNALKQAIKYRKDWQAEKKKRAEARKATPEKLARVKVGDIYYSSWGYDQTNLTYYQVVSKKGCFVEVRKIKQKMVEATCWAAGNFVPCKDEFCGDVMRKKLSFYGDQSKFTGEYGSETCWEWDGQKKYCSWYA